MDVLEKKKLIIVGASGFGREMIKYINDINELNPEWEIQGFIDDNPAALEGYACDYTIIGRLDEWIPKEDEWFVCALAFPRVKRLVVEKLMSRGAKFVTLIHPTVSIHPHSEIGYGCVLTPNSVISVNSRVGKFVSVLGSSVAHDAFVGDWSTLSGRCSLNGHVSVGEMVYMGCGVMVAPSKKIGNSATVGIGSVVVSNVKPGSTVFGNPAKKIDF